LTRCGGITRGKWWLRLWVPYSPDSSAESMPDRENILHKVRTALGRRGGEAPERAPSTRLLVPEMSPSEKVERLMREFPTRAERADSKEQACEMVRSMLAGRPAVALRHPLLESLGILGLPGITVVAAKAAEIRSAAATAEVGISCPAYALADPGALVVLSSGCDERLISLLPPAHIAVVSADTVLSGLDELFAVVPDPAAVSSSMVLIGGPSRTGDIEMTLVQGVHGPGELSLVIV
jgi:L-lactate dehydrogenase complex protein LldG